MIGIQEANKKALDVLLSGQPFLVDMGVAVDTIPGMTDRTLLHAGPPIEWKDMSGPMRGAVMAACMYEGWADTPEAAVRFAESGAINFSPCHHHHAVGPMAGVTSP